MRRSPWLSRRFRCCSLIPRSKLRGWESLPPHQYNWPYKAFLPCLPYYLCLLIERKTCKISLWSAGCKCLFFWCWKVNISFSHVPSTNRNHGAFRNSSEHPNGSRRKQDPDRENTAPYSRLLKYFPGIIFSDGPNQAAGTPFASWLYLIQPAQRSWHEALSKESSRDVEMG